MVLRTINKSAELSAQALHADKDAEACRKLWAAVVERIWFDALGETGSGITVGGRDWKKRYRKTVTLHREMLIRDARSCMKSEYFDGLCDLAGVSAAVIRAEFQRRIRDMDENEQTKRLKP